MSADQACRAEPGVMPAGWGRAGRGELRPVQHLEILGADGRLASFGREGTGRYRAAAVAGSCSSHGTVTAMSNLPGTIEAEGTCPPCGRRHGRAAVRAGLLAVGWLIVAVLGLAAVLRLVAWDSVQPLVVLDALTLVVYLPAWVVAAGALIARRWRLTAAAAVIVAAQLAFVLPELLAAVPVPTWARHAPAMRVFDANIDQSLRFQTGYVRAIEQDRPDLVTLEEFTPSALQAMVASGVLAGFPYRCAAPAPARPAS